MGPATTVSATSLVDETLLDVDFERGARGQAWPGRHGADRDMGVATAIRPMTLRELLVLLLVRAGFHRWTPAMVGKRNERVLHKYLLRAARDVRVGGEALAERLHFCLPGVWAELHGAYPQRVLRGRLTGNATQPRQRMVLVGEYSGLERVGDRLRIRLKSLPGKVLTLRSTAWAECLRQCGIAPMDMAEQLTNSGAHLLMAAFATECGARELDVDVAALVAMSSHWIPVDTVHALVLVDTLVAQNRRFAVVWPHMRPAEHVPPSVWLLDCGARAVALRVWPDRDRPHSASGAELHQSGAPHRGWIWNLGSPMPKLPPPY